MTSLSVTSGQTITTSTSIGGADTVTVAAGGAITVGVASPDLLWSAAATGGGVTIDNDGSISQTGSGATARPAIGANAVTGTLTIVNTGTISSAGGPALGFGPVPAGGSEIVTNSGTISGGNGMAIQFGAGNDTLTLQSGYSITGRVIGGAGSNTLILSGASGGSFRGATEFGAGNAVTFAGFDGFNTLDVQSGAWSLFGGGYYDTINITSGATLIVDEANGAANGNPSDSGIGPLNTTLTINNNGVLRLVNPTAFNFGFDPAVTENSTTGPTILSGTGGVEVSGFFTVNPNTNFTIAGGLTALSGGTSLVFGTVNANVTINAGAVVQLGDGGAQLTNAYNGSTYTDPGNLGAINGAILDNGTLKVDRLDTYVLGGALTGNGVLQKLGAGTLTLQGSTNFAGRILADGGVINLAGTIAFTQANIPAVGSSGLSSSGPVTINNTGMLTSSNSAAINMASAASGVTVTNSGTISGGTALSSKIAIVLSTHDDSLTNTGVINGLVYLNGGNDQLDSHLGTINGFVVAGASANILLGAEDNNVGLAQGTHTVDGGGGANTVGYGGATAGVRVSLGLQGQSQNTGVGTDTLSHFQTLIGSNYNDILEGGGSASTTLTGSGGSDIFVYRTGDGAVTVTDFQDTLGDAIDLSGAGAFYSLADVLAKATQSGSDTVITVGTGSLRLQGVSMNSLTTTDFLFYPEPSVGPGVGGAPQTGSGTVNGTSGSDWLQGGGGGDTLHGGAGSDYIDGGAGLNTAVYDGVFRQYTLYGALGTVAGGPEGGADVLTNIQRVQFVDGYVSVSPTDTAGQVYRLYLGALGRTPDPAGLAGWAHALNTGTALQSVANSFVTSAEFQNVYGSLSDTGFVTLLYNNVLHRGPDSGGLAGWLGALSQGVARAQIVLGFTESQENINNLAAAVEQGLWVGNVDAAEVARLYDTTLSRLPDLQGLTGWTLALENGSASLLQEINGFMASAEFQATYGSLTNTAFVTLLYNNTLHRGPDPGGLSGWVGALNSGVSRAEVVLGFSESAEHIADTAPHIDYGIWLA